MTRRLFGSLIGIMALGALVVSLAAPALADGALTVKNATIDSPVPVEVRIGTAIDTAVPAAYATLKKGETIVLDPTNLQYFWRRANGGTDWTDWQRVDVRYGNQNVEF